jgi:carboxymethylenebutenolidase
MVAARRARSTRVLLALAALVLVCSLGSRRASSAEPPKLPPGEDAARARLDASPRHGEYAAVDVGGTPVKTWVVYPERKDKAPVVIVIHEIFGLTDWIKSVADQLAADGFIAVAPDLLSGKGPKGGGTDAFPGRDAAIEAVSGLPRAEVNARLNAVRAYALGLPAANGKLATVGFCWGGASSFAYAAAQPALDAAVVYYGTPPPDLAPVKAPVLGLYGGNDARVNATIESTTAKMHELGKSYEPHVYYGAGHGFLRAQGEPDNAQAAEKAWPRTLEFLREHTRQGPAA